MTLDELEKRIRASGYENADELVRMCRDDENMFRLVAGTAIFDTEKLPHSLKKWFHDGNTGKVTALGLFIGFLRSRANDADFIDRWQGFMSLDREGKRKLCWAAWEHYKSRRPRDIAKEKGDKNVAAHLADDDFVDGLRNPRYLIYKPSRQLLTMLRRDGRHAMKYYVERTVTEYFFQDENVSI